MNYIKITTSDGDTRWLNLAHISRVTLGRETNGTPILAIFFQETQPQAVLKIHGTDAVNQQAIDSLIEVLDRHALETVESSSL